MLLDWSEFWARNQEQLRQILIGLSIVSTINKMCTLGVFFPIFLLLINVVIIGMFFLFVININIIWLWSLDFVDWEFS